MSENTCQRGELEGGRGRRTAPQPNDAECNVERCRYLTQLFCVGRDGRRVLWIVLAPSMTCAAFTKHSPTICSTLTRLSEPAMLGPQPGQAQVQGRAFASSVPLLSDGSETLGARGCYNSKAHAKEARGTDNRDRAPCSACSPWKARHTLTIPILVAHRAGAIAFTID